MRGVEASTSSAVCTAATVPTGTFREYGPSGGVCFSRSSGFSASRSCSGTPDSVASRASRVLFGTVTSSYRSGSSGTTVKP